MAAKQVRLCRNGQRRANIAAGILHHQRHGSRGWNAFVIAYHLARRGARVRRRNGHQCGCARLLRRAGVARGLPGTFGAHARHDRPATAGKFNEAHCQLIALSVSETQHFGDHRGHDAMRAILKNKVHLPAQCLPVNGFIVVIRELDNGKDAGEHYNKG